MQTQQNGALISWCSVNDRFEGAPLETVRRLLQYGWNLKQGWKGVERLKTHLAGRLPNDMMNHLIWEGGKDQESLSGLIPFRAKFEHLGLRNLSMRKSVSVSVLFTFGVEPSCLWASYSVHWRIPNRISGLYPPVDCYTNQPTPPPVWTKMSPDIVNITPGPSRA